MNARLILHTPQVAAIDGLRPERAPALVQVLGIVGFTLLTVLGAKVSLYLWEVPITLQTLAVYASGLYLGSRNGFLAQLLYLTLGLFFPVFAGETFGPAYLLTAGTAGYLLAYPLVALLVGRLSQRWNTLTGSVLCLVLGSLLLFTMGVAGLHFITGMPWAEALDKGWLRFIPFDLAKLLFVGLLYTGTRHIALR
jgi:biotin transport system substrate-specific component